LTKVEKEEIEAGNKPAARQFTWEETQRALQFGYIARRSSWPGECYLAAAFILASVGLHVLLIPDSIPGDPTHQVDPALIRVFVATDEDKDAADWLLKATPRTQHPQGDRE
jgi:hypothetical protein